MTSWHLLDAVEHRVIPSPSRLGEALITGWVDATLFWGFDVVTRRAFRQWVP